MRAPSDQSDNHVRQCEHGVLRVRRIFPDPKPINVYVVVLG